ncbi:MAG: C69 family dipeptidase [Tatlockia sp.]|nr:C69 family dipeptidase [Tatlockia sp.]
MKYSTPILSCLLTNILILNSISTVFACTTLIVGKDAAQEGKTIMARTSDTIDARRAKNLKIYYDKDSSKSYIGLPYWDIEDDEKNDMSQVTTNANGVSLSATETIRSNPKVLALDSPAYSKKGIAEPNIPGLIMPFATSARDGVDILGKAIEERGLASKTGFGVLFSDKREAWYLETLSGHQWVAIKIPDDVYFVAANGPGQIQAYSPTQYKYKFSHFKGKTPMEFANENNIAQKTTLNEFDFRKTFADIQNPRNPKKNYVRVAYIQHRFNPSSRLFDLTTINNGTFPTFLKPEKKISVNDVQTILTSHYQESKDIDPYYLYNNDINQSDSYRSIATLNTSNAHVTIVDNTSGNADVNINNLEYIALGMPTISFYLPIYFGITEVPDALDGATNKADSENEKLFWQFRRLQTLVFLSDPEKNIEFNPEKSKKIIQEKYLNLAKEVEKERLAMEANYKQNRDRTIINDFTKNTVDKLSKLNRQLIQVLMERLDIIEKYNLQDVQERANWFTAKVREQECHFKPAHCQKKFKNLGSN